MMVVHGNIVNTDVEAESLIGLIGKEVSIHGVIYKIREMSDFAFVLIQTKRHLVQCVWSEDFSLFPLSELECNMSIMLRGEVVSEERSSTGYELRMISIRKLSKPEDQTPVVINNKKVGVSLDTLLDYRPVTLRNAKERAIFKIQEGLSNGFRKFFKENNFTEIHTPKIVYSGAEGGANIFTLDYFGKKAYLAQSPQFYKQMMVGVFERVYEIAPVFRAEKHHTTRHINEYTSVDFEIGFIESFTDLMSYETKMLAETLEFLQSHYENELILLDVKIPDAKTIPSVTFVEAKQMIEESYKRVSDDPEDFDPEEEKLLCELIKKETGSEFVFVTHYKSSKRPFYAMDTPGQSELTDSFDLLFRGLEITTGGQRIHNYKDQVEKMKKRGMDVELFKSYLMAHQYGLPPHGGLGLGLERFTARLLDLPNVRQATLFPRDTQRLDP